MIQLSRIVIAIIGSPVELLYRIIGKKWILAETISYTHSTGWSLTACKGMLYDSFTWAPNLRDIYGKKSKAAALHDKGWITGKKDDAAILTFDENNFVFGEILKKEHHPLWVQKLYKKGVSLDFLRKKWEKLHKHR